MYLVKYNDINLPVIVLLLSMIVLSTLSSSRATAVSEEHKVTSNLGTIEIMSKILMLWIKLSSQFGCGSENC